MRLRISDILIGIVLTVGLVLLVILAVNSNNDKKEQESANKNENNPGVNSTTPTTSISYDAYIVIDKYLFGTSKNGSMVPIEQSRVNDIKELFKIYINYDHFKDGYLKYINTFNILDESKTVNTYEGKLCANTSGINVDYIKYELSTEINSDDKDILSREFKINSVNNIKLFQKAVGDFDQNGIDDEIVVLTNAVSSQDSDDFSNSYNVAYLILNDKLIKLHLQKYEDFEEFPPYYYINTVFNFNNNIYIALDKESVPEALHQIKGMSIYKVTGNSAKMIVK